MGQGCSSSLGVIVDTSRADRFAESPDLVMREIVHSSVATIRDLRKKAHQERFGGAGSSYKSNQTVPLQSNGQEHLLFHNLVAQEKQQMRTSTSHGSLTIRDALTNHSDHNKPHHKQRRGRKIAESFEAERQTTAEQEIPAWQRNNHGGETKVAAPVVVSEAALEDFEIDLASHIEKACPTRLWVRRRNFPKKRKMQSKRSNKQQQQQLQQNQPEQRPTNNADSSPPEPPEVVLLEEGQSYRRNKDYFGLQSTSSTSPNKKAGPEPLNNNNSNNNNPHSSTHIYAIRYSEDGGKNFTISDKDANNSKTSNGKKHRESPPLWIPVTDDEATIAGMFSHANMSLPPERDVVSWTTVSEEHDIYIVDLGLTPKNCDDLVTTTEQACRGRYAAYTYAKQTLGCKEYPLLAKAALGPVHSMVGAIADKFDGMGPDQKAKVARAKAKAQKAAQAQKEAQAAAAQANASSTETETQPTSPPVVNSGEEQKQSSSSGSDGDKKDASENNADVKQAGSNASKTIAPTIPQMHQQVLQLDDREPHIVKYDVTKKERQKLDMHTDKSEWTFLIALSNGCGLDYEGGGTYFECLDATVHIQKGHALVFPGKLRHKGQAIHHGLRFLLVGFLIDKGEAATASGNAATVDSKATDSSTLAGNGTQDDLANAKASQPAAPYPTPMVAAA